MHEQSDLSVNRRFIFPTKSEVKRDLAWANGIPMVRKLRQRKLCFFVEFFTIEVNMPLREIQKIFNQAGYRVLGAQFNFKMNPLSDTVIFTIKPYVHSIIEEA